MNKEDMTNPPYLRPCDSRKNTLIMPDASRHGLGFVMCQEVDQNEPIRVKKGLQ